MFGQWEAVAHIFDLLVSFGVLTAVFAAIYKLMPRASIKWRDVWVGAVFTAVLFAIGKLLIGLYLGKSNIGSSFGAFGSLVIVMVWIYYSAQIFLLGAEFTWVYAHEAGSRRGVAVEKNNLAEAAPAPAPVAAAVPQAAPVIMVAPNPARPLLKRKRVFGAAVAAAFLGGAVLRLVIAELTLTR
jgi:hypothetical protein